MGSKTFIKNWYDTAIDSTKPVCAQVDDIAKRAGVHSNTIRRMVKTGDAGLSTLVKLARATGFEIGMTCRTTGDSAGYLAAAKELSQ